MGLSLRWVVVDCHDVGKVSEFWAGALGRERGYVSPEFATLPGDPELVFVAVAESKAAKNRWHLDWNADDRETEVRRLVVLGATRGADQEEPELGLVWTTLRDPEDNEFCVVQTDAG